MITISKALKVGRVAKFQASMSIAEFLERFPGIHNLKANSLRIGAILKRISQKSVIRLAVIFIYLFGSYSHAAQDYSGSGVINYSVFSPNEQGKKLNEMGFRFRFGVRNGLWQIRIEEFPEKKGSPLSYVDASYDGTNTYVITGLRQEYVERNSALSGKDKSVSVDVIGEIFPIDFAPPSPFPINPVWFAYCSGQYLEQATDNSLCPLWQENRRYIIAADHLTSAVFQKLDSKLSLPSECTQFDDGRIYNIDFTKAEPVLAPSYRFPGVFSNGFPRITYRTIQTTNVAGCVLPVKFSLQQFKPDSQGRSSNDVVLLCEYEGTLENIEFGRSDVKPGDGIKRNAAIDDYRPVKLKPIRKVVQYRNPGDSWLPMAPGSVAYTTYRKLASTPTGPPPGQSKRRVVVICVFLALVSIPVAIILARRFARKTAN